MFTEGFKLIMHIIDWHLLSITIPTIFVAFKYVQTRQSKSNRKSSVYPCRMHIYLRDLAAQAVIYIWI